MTDAAWRVAQELDAKAILCLTSTGFTVRAIALQTSVRLVKRVPSSRTPVSADAAHPTGRWSGTL